MCTPVLFTLQLFDSDDVLRQLDAPRVSLNSSIATFNFPTNIFTDRALYFVLFGINAEGTICSPKSMTEFYNFAQLFEGNSQIIVVANNYNDYFLDSHTQCLHANRSSLCLQVPDNIVGSILYFIWPKTRLNSDGYCSCLPHSYSFINCASNCGSVYEFVLTSASVCLQNSISLQENDTLKVYFVYIDRLCSRTRCLYSFFSSYKITQQSMYNNNYSLYV